MDPVNRAAALSGGSAPDLLAEIEAAIDDLGVYPREWHHADGTVHVRTPEENGWNRAVMDIQKAIAAERRAAALRGAAPLNRPGYCPRHGLVGPPDTVCPKCAEQAAPPSEPPTRGIPAAGEVFYVRGSGSELREAVRRVLAAWNDDVPWLDFRQALIKLSAALARLDGQTEETAG